MPTAPPGGPGPSSRPSQRQTQPPAASPYSGRTIARCVVGERLGRGATSHVFRAHYEPLGKDVALKILAREGRGSEEVRARFLSEARAVAKLDHENIVRVLDVVEDEGLLCILMELVEGPTLQDRLDDEDVLPPVHALRIASQVARGLEAAHAERVVHRDVKPANVMLSGKPGQETVKVVDFGLAMQQEMNRVGTPLFMSPEAAQGKRIDEKSDVYALGVCLYLMLTGTLPFTGANVKEILAAQVNGELVPPSERRPQLGEDFDEVLKKLLVKSKGYRPSAADAAELLEDLVDELESREAGVRVRRRQRRLPRRKKSNAAMIVGVGIGLLAIAGVIFALSGGKEPPPTPPVPTRAELAKNAYDDADRAIAKSPANPAEARRRWSLVEKEFAGTEAGARAAQKRKEMDEILAKSKKPEPQSSAAKPKPVAPTPGRAAPAPAVDPKVLVARMNDAVKRFAWGEATSNWEEADAPEGTSDAAWSQKGARIELLAKEFTNKMDAGIRAARTKIKAKDVAADAKDSEVLVGANSAGVIVSDGNAQHTLEWPKVKAEAFAANGAIGRSLDSADVDTNLVLAALAVEIGLPVKASRDYMGNVKLLLDQESASEKLRPLFGGSD